jgi:hypothetical protein
MNCSPVFSPSVVNKSPTAAGQFLQRCQSSRLGIILTVFELSMGAFFLLNTSKKTIYKYPEF